MRRNFLLQTAIIMLNAFAWIGSVRADIVIGLATPMTGGMAWFGEQPQCSLSLGRTHPGELCRIERETELLGLGQWLRW